MSYLRIDKALCTGCRICEAACSMAKEGVVNRAKSRIRIYRRDVIKLKYLVCVQCRNPVCVSACPENAIVHDEKGIRVIYDRCSGCGECTEVCNRVFLSPEGDKALMCDQCGACIPACPENALSIRE